MPSNKRWCVEVRRVYFSGREGWFTKQLFKTRTLAYDFLLANWGRYGYSLSHVKRVK